MVTTTDLELRASERLLDDVGARGDDELRFLLMAKLYELHKVSSGRAAEICGMTLVSFVERLGAIGVPVFTLPDDQIEKELKDG